MIRFGSGVNANLLMTRFTFGLGVFPLQGKLRHFGIVVVESFRGPVLGVVAAFAVRFAYSSRLAGHTRLGQLTQVHIKVARAARRVDPPIVVDGLAPGTAQVGPMASVAGCLAMCPR